MGNQHLNRTGRRSAGRTAVPPYHKNEIKRGIPNGETSLLAFETKKKNIITDDEATRKLVMQVVNVNNSRVPYDSIRIVLKRKMRALYW